jgi:hypothetical protein
VSVSRSTGIVIAIICDSFEEAKTEFNELFGDTASGLMIMEEKVYLLI